MPDFPAIFFDRDDTLIANYSVVPDGDLGDPDLVTLLPDALDTCKVLKQAGYKLVVITNQGGVARGKYDTAAVRAVNEEVNRQLEHLLDALYFCPYHPEGTVPEFTREHPWRKPQPGMLLRAQLDLDLDLEESWFIGDALRDCKAGRAAGCRTILLVGTRGQSPEPIEHPSIDHTVTSLPEAVELILGK